MYPSYYNMYYNNPYNPEFQANYYHSTIDGRQFGGVQPPSSAPPGQELEEGPPSAPPPSFVPQQAQAQQFGEFGVATGNMLSCLHRYTYVWLRGFEQFWFYPTFIGRNSVIGFRWTGSRWVQQRIRFRQILSFSCV